VDILALKLHEEGGLGSGVLAAFEKADTTDGS
jgi:hypothetical protein